MSTTREPRAVYRVTLAALPSGLPAPVRVRRLLKVALRQLALKCIDIEEISSGPPRTGHDAVAAAPHRAPPAG